MQLFLTALFTGLLMMSSAGHADIIRAKAFCSELISASADGRFVAVLQDTSRANAPAIELGRIERDSPGNPPYEFEIEYDPRAIKQGHTYTLRASLFSATGQLLFVTDTHIPLITRGAPKEVEMIMKLVARAPTPAISSVGAHGLRLPASFTGTLPCGDFVPYRPMARSDLSHAADLSRGARLARRRSGW